MSLPESLERAATNLANLADQIRPANGDPDRLLEDLKPEAASQLLVWILANEPDVADELVSAWGEWEKGADVLLGISDASMSEHGVSKAGRKILRKAHHRLRSRGIDVQAAAEPTVSTRRLEVVEDSFEAAYLSAPDFRGARVGYLAEGHPAGGARLFEIRFDEARGILEFKVYNASRSKIRGFLRSMSVAQAQRLFDVPRLALCALVRRASLAQPSDRPLPSGFMEWRGRLFPDSLASEPTPGGLIRAELAEAGDAPDVEAGIVSLVGATTSNPFFALVSALISRSQVFEFQMLDQADILTLMRRALTDTERGLGKRKLSIDDDPQIRAREMVFEDERGWEHLGVPMKFSHEPGVPRLKFAALGEDGPEIIKSLGYSDEDVAAMRRQGVITVP